MKTRIDKTAHISSECKDLLTTLVRRVARVRKRLVIESILKTLALGLILLPIYMMLYAWIDHIFHLGPILRMAALIMLIAGLAWLLFYWARIFLSHVSLSRAANYVESVHSYHQQLVAAIEYHEQAADYPYSHQLAEHMIRQVHTESDQDRFLTTVKKWPSLLSAVVVFSAVISMLYLFGSHYRYYSRYFTRLVKPTAAVEPLPATDLFVITEEIIAEPRDPLVLVAGIGGRIPESGTLYIESDLSGSGSDAIAPDQRLTIPLLPGKNGNGEEIFRAELSLREKGDYRYYFESGQSKTVPQKIQITEFPKIQSITAEVMASDSQWVKPYTEQIEKTSLKVFKDSYVTLKVKTNQPLRDVEVLLPDQRKQAGRFQQQDEFSIAFKAKEASKIQFDLTNTQGLKSRKPSILEVQIKQDEPPTFNLLSPTSDYIASNVASIPVEFEVADDFALQSASLYFEFNSGRTVTIPLEDMKPGSKTATISTVLELEEYDLNISDSIIFYATANDVKTGLGAANPPGQSRPYFIEIRPYRKTIIQPDFSEPDMTTPPPVHETLMSVLEYNRAFLKKTWMMSQKPELNAGDKKRLTAMSDDVEYTAQQLTMIRNNPRYEFSPEQISTIDIVLDDYALAAKTLVKYQPKAALPPEKHGYHEIRSLIQELGECPPPIGGMELETRDKLELKDPIHVTRAEKERIDGQVESLAQELAELTKEQDQLRQEFVKFLEQQQKNRLQQKVTDVQNWTETQETEMPLSPTPDNAASGQSTPKTVQGARPNLKNMQAAGGGQVFADSQQAQSVPMENSPSSQTPPQQDENQNAMASGQGQQGQQSQNSTNRPKSGQQGENKEATLNEVLRMMRAQQNQLQDRLNELNEQLAAIPIPSEKASGSAKGAAQNRQSAQSHLEKAADHMDNFDKQLAEQYYRPNLSEALMDQAGQSLDDAQSEMGKAHLAMAAEYGDAQRQLAIETENLARQLEALADAYARLSEESKQRHLEQLTERAAAFLKTLPLELSQEHQMANSQQGDGQQNASPSSAGTQTSAFGGVIVGGNNGGQAGDASEGMIRRAYLLAGQLRSIAIRVRQKATPLTEMQFSHPSFADEENHFFEQTATYQSGQEQL